MSDQEKGAPCVSLEALSLKISTIEEQNALLLQQIADLSMTVYDQSDQLRKTEEALNQEFRKLQTGGAQRAMASLFHKLFKELIEHANRLDDLLEFSGEKESLSVLQSHFEGIVREWGLVPIAIDEGREQFDPEIHESVEDMDEVIPGAIPGNTIVKVKQRGWLFHGTVLQCPKVVVS